MIRHRRLYYSLLLSQKWYLVKVEDLLSEAVGPTLNKLKTNVNVCYEIYFIEGTLDEFI